MRQGYGELVRSYRVAAGLTQEELAALSGLDVRTISDIERGRTTRPHRSSADLLARALNRADLAWESATARLPRPTGPGSASPAIRGSAGDASSAPPHQAVPRQLPGGVRGFTGRARELAMLTGLLDQAGQERPGTVVISAIGGTAGVGKTALAVHWAHQVAELFPDGQLYVNLRGYDCERPVLAADTLAGFLRALGVTGRDIPAGIDERAACYRGLLAGRRMLVLLDNAREVEQVRPLLPASPTCVAVVTSRESLPGLVARDGAVRLDLDLLPAAEAASLLQVLIGARANADQGAVEALAGLCGRLPLALRVAAELAAARPAAPLAHLVAELASRQDRLDLLEAGEDPQTTVREVFSWSYRHLETAAGQVFRLAGLHPGPDLDAYAATALTAGTAVAATGRLLERLARAHLIHPAAPSRYGIHDLLRSYAAGLAAAIDGDGECRAALTRLFDHYLHSAAVAMDMLYPAERHHRPRVPAPSTPAPPMADPAAALAWLDAHRAVLVAVAGHAADNGWPAHATRLSATLYRYLDRGGHFPEASTIHSYARRAARQAGDPAGEAQALTSLGRAGWWQGRSPQATRHLRQAVTLSRRAGDQSGQASALITLGIIDFQQCRYRQATHRQQQALALSRQAGDQVNEAYALSNLALVAQRRGRYPQAARYLRQALDLCRQAGDQSGEARTLGNLGTVELDWGRYPQAARYLRQALTLFRQTGDRTGEAYTMGNLGRVEQRRGRYSQAARYQQRTLTLLHQTGDRIAEAGAFIELGEAFLADGHPGHARTEYATALTLARQVGDKYQQARARYGLGQACLTAGKPGQARHHWEHALTLYTRLSSPEASKVRASLRDLGPPARQRPSA